MKREKIKIYILICPKTKKILTVNHDEFTYYKLSEPTSSNFTHVALFDEDDNIAFTEYFNTVIRAKDIDISTLEKRYIDFDIVANYMSITSRTVVKKESSEIDESEIVEKDIEKSNTSNNNFLTRNCYWIGDEWIQPPVKIKHGDLVDVKCEGYLGTLLGRYIGKGYGVVELYNYATGIKHVVGKVVSRGLDMNPQLVSDETLFEFIND